MTNKEPTFTSVRRPAFGPINVRVGRSGERARCDACGVAVVATEVQAAAPPVAPGERAP